MTKPKSKGKGIYIKVGALIVGALLSLMVVVSIVKFGTIFFVVPVWWWIAHKLVNATGIDIWLARGIAALIVIPFIYIITLVFSWKKSKRRAGIALLAITTAIICFGMFHISQDIYFSFKTGEAMKYYIITPQGEYKFSSSPGYDPVWGIKYTKVTPEVIEEYIRKTGRRHLNQERSSSFLSEEEEKVLVKHLESLNLNRLTDIQKLLEFAEILSKSNNDYSEQLCKILTTDSLTDLPVSWWKPAYNRYRREEWYSMGLFSGWGKHEDYWHTDYTKELISCLVKIGSMKAIPTLLYICVDADIEKVRNAAKEAIIEIKRRNAYSR